MPASAAWNERQRAAGALAAILLSLLCVCCTQAPTNCRDRVVASYERLKTSGRPYRKETVVVHERQTFHEITEFLPPDRMRKITDYGVRGYETSEMIRVGPRAWSNEGGRWRGWEPGLAEEIYGDSMDFSLLPDRIVTRAPDFECLGRIDYRGKRYIGYRVRAHGIVVVIDSSSTEPLSEEKQQELLAKAQRMPPERRTVLVDWPSMLPAFDLTAPENQLDKPRMIEQYTYPDDIKIEPPRND
jgi:hypothetical protein